jgi:hypothetical protein
MMSRCLSERTILRLIAGGGRDPQRAHLAACHRCDARYRAIGRDLDRVTQVLLHTEPQHRPPSLLARYWMPATAAAVAGLALLVWVEITVWRAVTPTQPEEVTAFLSDLSATMFSARDARAGGGDSGLGAFSDDSPAVGCSPDPLGIIGCESDNANEGPAETNPGGRR